VQCMVEIVSSSCVNGIIYSKTLYSEECALAFDDRMRTTRGSGNVFRLGYITMYVIRQCISPLNLSCSWVFCSRRTHAVYGPNKKPCMRRRSTTKAECMSTDTTQLNPTQLDMYWLKTQLNSTGQISARRRVF